MQTKIIDGKKIRDSIKEELISKVTFFSGEVPRLVLFRVGENPVVDIFIRAKKRFGESVGVDVEIQNLPDSITEDELIEKIIFFSKPNTGIVVQLPLPKHIDSKNILNSIPVRNDVDMLSEKSLELLSAGKSAILPPVVGAINAIFLLEGVDLYSKNIVVIGRGKLVGEPTMLWLQSLGLDPILITRSTEDASGKIASADVVISGAGKPSLISAEMIKEGSIMIDAGASELAEKLVGDIDESVLGKASLYTPVPGGIGPITVAILFRNLLEINKKQ